MIEKLSAVQHAHQVQDINDRIREFDMARGITPKKSSSSSTKRSVVDSLNQGAFAKKRKTNEDEDIIVVDDQQLEQGEPVWFSKEWLKDWSKKPSEFVLNWEPKEVCGHVLPHTGYYAHHVACKHSHLNPDEKKRRLIPFAVWTLLLKYVHGLQHAVDSGLVPVFQEKIKPCKECMREIEKDNDAIEMLEREAKMQRVRLKGMLAELRTVDRVFADLSAATKQTGHHRTNFPGSRYCLLSREFYDTLKTWIHNPHSDPPTCVDNSSLFCDHGLLKFDINEFRYRGILNQTPSLWKWESRPFAPTNSMSNSNSNSNSGMNMDLRTISNSEMDVDLPRKSLFFHPQPLVCQKDPQKHWLPYVFVAKEEWDVLMQFYFGSPGPRIDVAAETWFLRSEEEGTMMEWETLLASRENPDTKQIETLEPCWDCIKAAKREWVEGSIWVRRLDGGDKAATEALTKNTSIRPRAMQLDDSSQIVVISENETVQAPAPRRTSRPTKPINIPSESNSESEAELDVKSKSKSKKKEDEAKPLVRQKTLKGFIANDGIIPADDYCSPKGSRTSTRRRTRDAVKIAASSWMKVKDLKLEIMNKMNLSPIQQTIFVYGHEMDDSEATLGDFDVLEDMFLDLVVYDGEESSPGGRFLYNETCIARSLHSKKHLGKVARLKLDSKERHYWVVMVLAR